MTDLYIPLQITPGISGVYLKPICGKDEILVEDVSTKTALMLLEGLIRIDGGDYPMNKISSAKICTPDRDRILASLYISIYGPKVESTVPCEECNELFDLDFSLVDLLNHYQPEPVLQLKDSGYQLESGSIFRFPTGEDELLLSGIHQNVAEFFLISRCIVKGDPGKDGATVQTKMAEIAPILNVEMKATCPTCSHVHDVQFDIQSFLLTKLKQQRPQLIQEIHCIARNYHWSQESILALSRNLRKQYASLIESE